MILQMRQVNSSIAFNVNYYASIVLFQLKQRLDRMEHRVTLPQNNKSNNSIIHNSNNSFSLDSFPDNMTHDTGFCADNEDSKDNLKVMGLCSEESDYKPLILNADRHSTDRDSGGDSMGPSDRCYTTNRRNKSSKYFIPIILLYNIQYKFYF